MNKLRVLLLVLTLTAVVVAQPQRQKQVEPLPKTVGVEIGRNIAPAPKIRITLNTRNVPVVQVEAYPIDPVLWLRKASPDWQGQTHEPKPVAIGPRAKVWNVSVATKDNPPNPLQKDRYYSRQVNLPTLPNGVYRLEVSGGGTSAWSVVNITDLGVVVKQSPKNLLAWVTDALKGSTIGNARILIFNHRTGKMVGDGRTRSDGTYFTPLQPGEYQIVVNQGRDFAGIPSYGENPNGRLVAHFQTDRPVYRPGQTIQFKAILRLTDDTRYSVPANAKVTVELRDPKDNPVDRLNLQSSAIGSVAGQFEIPQEGAVGQYSMVLTVLNRQAYQTLNVAEYRKPEYKVDLAPVAKRYMAGETIQFKVSAQYYFGAPVAQASVEYSVRRLTDSDWGSYGAYDNGANYYPNDAYNLQPFVAEDKVNTDNNGEAIISIKSDPKAPDSEYVIHCTVTDSSRRQVQGDGSVPVYAASVRLSLSTDLLTTPLGSLIPVVVTATDLDAKPCPADVTLIEWHQVWDEKKNEYKTVELTRTKVTIPTSGRAKATMPAAAEGDIYIEARTLDPTGRLASTILQTYVVGPGEKGEREQTQPTIATKLNRKTYAPGDSVNATILANTKKWPILVVAEGQDIYDYKVLPGSGSWVFRTNKSMSPNAFLTAEQWVKGELYSSNTVVPLPNPDNALTVQLTPDKAEYRPGDQATYRIKTLDAHNKPAPAEVAINVVDAAIYAISPDNTPDLYQRFWGIRPDEITLHQAAPEELSGGAYQHVSTVAPLRQRFEDTAYWNAFAETDAEGNGSITFEMPGNLTTWKSWARAVDGETQVGTASASVVATRPVTLRLATPRQMAVGDKLTIIGTVNNRTTAGHEFKVSLKAEGLVLVSPSEQSLTVPANAAATVEWQLSADHIGAQPPALTAQVVCTDVSDADRADYSDALRMVFPVVPDGVPVDIKTGGVVSDNASSNLELPNDKIEPATKTTVRIWSGVKPDLERTVREVLRAYRYGVMPTADQLELWPMAPDDIDRKELGEILAHLSRSEQSDGWGYWDSCRSDPVVTAAVLRAMCLAKDSVAIPSNLFDGAKHSAEYHFDRTNLWEYRALIAGSLALSGSSKAQEYLDRVVADGKNLSPYAKLRLAEGFFAMKENDKANAEIEEVLPTVSEGPTSAYLPVGEGIGWTANDEETTAQLLKELLAAGTHPDLQGKLAEWLVAPQVRWPSLEDQAGKALALNSYVAAHPTPADIGQASVEVAGISIPAQKAKIKDELLAEIPSADLKAGSNTIGIVHQGQGEVFYEIDSTVYQPLRNEKSDGIRVARRYEVKNSAGIWQELHRPVKAGEAVRCTVLIWGDAVPDVVRLISPLPAGFEYVSDEESTDAFGTESEVRDGAVVFYAVTEGKPLFYSYYIRPESEGDVDALPASAEVVRRPEKRGQSEAERIAVVK